MTEDQIERRVEKATDRYDAMLMSGAISQDTYTSFMRDLAKWADGQSRLAEIEERVRRRLS